MKQTSQERGFAHPALIVAILILVAALALGGWYVWQKNKGSQPANNSNSQSNNGEENGNPSTQQPNYLTLANGDVRLTLPEDWPYIKGSSDYCRSSVTSDITCKDGAVITPEAKAATQAGGPDFFGISVSVYENPERTKAQVWLEQDLDEGSASKTDATSNNPINGYDTYYWKKSYGGDTGIEEVYYVFTADDKTVLVYARIYDPRILDDGRLVGDHRRFESAIGEMAKTIKIQY